MKRTLLWGSVALGLILLLVLLTKIGTNDSAPANLEGDTVSTEEHIKGNPEAAITLVEYSDFQCPACAGTAPVLKQIVDEFSDDVRLVYRHFPLRAIHPLAQLAAQASIAAENQGEFWDMHDALFNTQNQWSALSQEEAEAFFSTLAVSLGLEQGQFDADMNSDAAVDAVNEDYRSGERANVSFTPSVFLNGTLVQPATYANLEAEISKLLAE